MNEPFVPDAPVEPERYEHFENIFPAELDRRDFFRIAGGGLVVALLATDALAQQRQRPGQREGRNSFRENWPQEIGAWLHVGEDGAVTAYSGKVELGQNVRTSLAQAVAEELRLPAERVRLVLADTDRVPFDMGTFGSRTTPAMAAQLHRAAAAAREALLDLAAEQGGVARGGLEVRDGQVVDPGSGRAFPFGELTKGKKLMKVIAEDVPTTPAKEWKVCGTSAPKADGRAIVTGAHKYASDVARPGMLFGKVLRPPSFGAELASADTDAAKQLPGVTLVHDGAFVGVAAATEQEAERALAAVRAEWKPGPQQPSEKELFAYLKEHPAEARGFGGRGRHAEGSVADGLKAAERTLAATYTVAYIAHVPLETRSAVAEWSGDKVTVWTGTQRPFAVRDEVAGALGVPRERVRVITPDTGSGYGGKHTGEAAVEAARLARAAGKPVRVAWTREEEMTWAYVRPAGVLEVNAGVGKDGRLTAWEFHNYNSGGSGIATPYAVPNQLVEFHPAKSPLRQGSYRALAATANHFARESHMDDLAHALGLDPLAFRMKNLTNDRLKAVLAAAAGRFGWGRSKPAAGRGFGMAGGTEKGSFVATCAEVAADAKSGRVKVERLVVAFECGAVVNPRHLENQVEGAAVMGLGGALFEAVHFADGKILNPRLSQYRVPRFADLPQVEVLLVDRKDIPSAGAGETPIVGVAPAVGNAIFQATGVRLRALPMVPNGLPGAGRKEASG
jgi:isoquinoline 1-oxidoreductase